MSTHTVSGYTKIFRHDIKGGFFANYEEAGNKNPDDEDADLFSILDTLDFFRGVDGKFLFKLCYPEFEGSTGGGHCNEWYQTSNPFTDSEITGFEKVKTEFELRTPGQTEAFEGLGKNGPGSADGHSAVSNSPLTSNWWMAVGAFKGAGGDKLPGPAEAEDQGQTVTVVELFASKARVNPSAGVGLSGELTVRCDEPGEDLDIGYNLKEVHLTCTRE